MANRKIDLNTINNHMQREQTPAAQLIEREEKKARQEKPKNDKPFTIWTTPENVRKWKAYQKAKKADFPTQAAFVEAALMEYMLQNPVTREEKEELLKSLEL